MLPLRFDDIAKEDILNLVAERVSERKTIEYKQALKVGNTEDRAEFLADVSSFANASGGDIIFGVSDERDAGGNATGVPAAIVPLALESPSVARGALEQLIQTGIQPRIPIVQVKSLDIPGYGDVVIVRVGKSWIAPHMVSYANRTRFFSRNSSTGKYQLDVQQIGAAFAQQRSVGERLRSWKTNRISKAISGDGPVTIKGSVLLIHFASGPALLADETPLPRVFDPGMAQRNNWLISLSAEYRRYNADGWLVSSQTTQSGSISYLQIFREGHLEFGDTYALFSEGASHIASKILEEKVAKTFEKALLLLKMIGTAEPVYVSLTLVGVRGRTMALPRRLQMLNSVSPPFDRDVIVSPDVMVQNLEEGYPFATTLIPLVDSVWQAAGLEGTPNINNDREWEV